MKEQIKEPFIPPERGHTIRHDIAELLESRALSAKDLSSRVGIPEKEVCEHLSHIRKSLDKRMDITPARCRSCGFVFQKREKLKKPGKCPACREESIEAPLFSIRTG